MPESIIVRPAVEHDFENWLPLWDGYNEFYGRHGATALPINVTRTTWSRFMDADEPMHALVAESAEGLLGIAHFLYHRSTIQPGPSCYLQDLYTVEAARGRSIARMLIQEVYRRAGEEGSPRVYWQTHESNTVAMKLYDRIAEKSGFVVYRKMLGAPGR